jgi:hypothetical protein
MSWDGLLWREGGQQSLNAELREGGREGGMWETLGGWATILRDSPWVRAGSGMGFLHLLMMVFFFFFFLWY